MYAGLAVHGWEKVPPPSGWACGARAHDSIVIVAFWRSIETHELVPLAVRTAWHHSTAAETAAREDRPPAHLARRAVDGLKHEAGHPARASRPWAVPRRPLRLRSARARAPGRPRRCPADRWQAPPSTRPLHSCTRLRRSEIVAVALHRIRGRRARAQRCDWSSRRQLPLPWDTLASIRKLVRLWDVVERAQKR